MTKYDKNCERFMNDPTFRVIVDCLYYMIVHHGFTPEELRDAADMASILHAERNTD